MSVHLFTVAFENDTELPKDNMVNTWYFEGSGSDPENVADMLTDFYTVVPTGGGFGISGYMSEQVLTGEYTIKAYDLADPKPRAPIYTVTRNMPGMSAAAALPSEVALCMSYAAAATSGVPAARRRGRIYLGGFIASANGSDGRPNSALRGDIARAGRDLIQASNASVSWEWQQYSQTNALGNIVASGWVDDAWDTQRRRGEAASSRITFTGGTP